MNTAEQLMRGQPQHFMAQQHFRPQVDDQFRGTPSSESMMSGIPRKLPSSRNRTNTVNTLESLPEMTTALAESDAMQLQELLQAHLANGLRGSGTVSRSSPPTYGALPHPTPSWFDGGSTPSDASDGSRNRRLHGVHGAAAQSLPALPDSWMDPWNPQNQSTSHGSQSRQQPQSPSSEWQQHLQSLQKLYRTGQLQQMEELPFFSDEPASSKQMPSFHQERRGDQDLNETYAQLEQTNSTIQSLLWLKDNPGEPVQPDTWKSGLWVLLGLIRKQLLSNSVEDVLHDRLVGVLVRVLVKAVPDMMSLVNTSRFSDDEVANVCPNDFRRLIAPIMMEHFDSGDHAPPHQQKVCSLLFAAMLRSSRTDAFA